MTIFKKLSWVIVTCLIILVSQPSMATVICVKDLNGNGTIEQDTERWQCIGSKAAYTCPYGAIQCVSQTYSLSGTAAATLTGVSGKTGINSIATQSGSKEITISAWQCPSGGATCSSVAIGSLKFNLGNVSGSATADVIDKIVGNGEKLDFYGCSGTPPCSGNGTLVGSITVSGATFAGTVIADNGILSLDASSGTQILVNGYSCTSGHGCTVKAAGFISFTGNSYSCPSGSQYPCVPDLSDSKYKCSTENCFDDSTQGMVGLTGKICVADLDGNGVLDFKTEVAQCTTVNGKDFCPLQASDCMALNVNSYCPDDGTQCANGGTWNSQTKRCESPMVASSYACHLTNASYSTLGECQDKCKITAVCTTPEVSVSGSASFGQEGFSSITGGNGTLTFTGSGGSGVIHVVNCNFSGTVTATSGAVLNDIKIVGGASLSIYQSTDTVNPKGSISITGCTVSGEIYSSSGQGFSGVSGANKTITGMWQNGTYSNGTSITFAADPNSGTGCLLGSTYPCSNGFCSEGGDCVAIDGCPAGYSKIGDGTTCIANATGATYTPVYVSTNDRCEIAKTPTCPDGYTYDQMTNMCSAAPVCPNGGVLDTVADKCAVDVSTFCPTGYTYDTVQDKCLMDPVCSSGGTYNSTSKLCEQADTPGCDAGYTYNSALKVCQVLPTCPQGSLNTSLDKCVVSALTLCPSPYVYNATVDACQLTPPCPAGSSYSTSVDKCIETPTFSCPSGTAWNNTSNKCEAASTMVCPSGSTWNSSLNKCQVSATCPSSGTLNGTVDKCQLDNSASCPSGYTFNLALSTCEEPPICSAGSYNTTAHKCTLSYSSLTCPSPGTYNSSTGLCETILTTLSAPSFNSCYRSCSGGSLLGSGNTIYVSGCGCSITVPGATFTGNVYLGCDVTQASHWSDGDGCSQIGYAYGDYITAGCSTMTVTGASVSGAVVSGWAGMAACTGGNWLGTGTPCPQSAFLLHFVYPSGYSTCPSGYTANESKCTASPNVVCPSGTWNSTLGLCVVTPTCDGGGTLNTTVDMCQKTPSSICVSGYTWNSTSGECEAVPACPSGFSYDASTDSCLADRVITCPSGSTYNSGAGVCQGDKLFTCALTGFTYDSGNNLCTQVVSCPSAGVVNATTDFCEIVLGNGSCPANYTFDGTNDACIKDPDCLSGSTYSAADDMCEKAGIHACASSYTWNATAGMCQATPACTGGGVFDTALNKCYLNGSEICPSGQTFDATTDKCEIAPPCMQSGLYSAARDRCELAAIINCPTGYTWNSTSQVCASAPACLQGTYDTSLKKCTGNVACPYGVQFQCLTSPTTGTLQCSPNTCADLSSSTTQQQADLTSYQNDGTTGATGCQGTIYVFNGHPGECRPDGLQTLFMDCCDEKEDHLLFLKENCTDQEYRTAVQKNKKYCHFVGQYCKQKWDAGTSILGGAIFGTIIGVGPIVLPPLEDCVQAAETFCCFSGILARIIHEQGRPQLKTFVSDLWGTPQSPNCRGFTTDEFAMLDFSKMDLSEYFNGIVNQVQATVQQTATAVKNRVEDFFNNSLKK